MFISHYIAGPSPRGIPEQRAMGPGNSKVALRQLLNHKQHPGQVNPMQVSKAGQNATFPWNMVKNCIQNVIFFNTFSDLFARKGHKYPYK